MHTLIITGGRIDRDFAFPFIRNTKFDHIIVVDGALKIWDEVVNSGPVMSKIDHLVGDFDTISPNILNKYLDQVGIEVHRFIPEKDNTDTDIAVRLAIELNRGGKTDALSGPRLAGCGDKDDKSELKWSDSGFENALSGSKVDNSGKIVANSGFGGYISGGMCGISWDDVDESGDDENLVTILGATGTRVDHMLANIYMLKAFAGTGIEARILDAHNRIRLVDGTVRISREEQYGQFVSLIPVSDTIHVSLKGMKYPLDHHSVALGESLCVSNEIVNSYSSVVIHEGSALLIESRD